MELLVPANLGAQTGLALRVPVQKPPDDTRIDESNATMKSGTDSRNLSQHAENAALLQETREKADAYGDPDRPVGPTPSFDISVLEVEHDLKQALAQIEAKRGHGGEDDLKKDDNSSAEGDRKDVRDEAALSGNIPAAPIELVAPYAVEAQV